ncbi:uncharacterized protein LOC114645332 [Erpetoichthys calabaricus]|uniref:uncharacterized protein LOC114645332 n=1 Tax=Erpetoichthys calabaricus TaxID=27687 RepID=UPI002234DE9A|nr:uncharacterized protein LOC114645332 [Erpetoichthys calabaricus]
MKLRGVGIKLSQSQACQQMENHNVDHKTHEPSVQHVMANWVMELSKQQKHSGESPLFTEQLLSSSKDEQLSGQPPSQSLKPLKARTTSPEGQLFYRPGRSHRYLQASVSESTAYELTEKSRPQSATLNPLLGRPTRSSLLRIKHLALSAACNTSVKETALQSPKDHVIRGTAQHRKTLQAVSTSAGENIHSFLIGARYNRERIIDFVAADKFGLYLCRTNPSHSFLRYSNINIAEVINRVSVHNIEETNMANTTEECQNNLLNLSKSPIARIQEAWERHSKNQKDEDDQKHKHMRRDEHGQTNFPALKMHITALPVHSKSSLRESGHRHKHLVVRSKVEDLSNNTIKFTSPPENQNNNSSGLLVRVIKPSKSHLLSEACGGSQPKSSL